MALALGLSFPPLKYNPIKDRDRHRHGTRVIAGLGDPFVLELAEKLEESVKSSPSSNKALYTLRQRCAEEVLGRQWPSGKDEAFRFTDVGFLRDCRIEPALERRSSSINVDTRGENTSNRLVIIDGLLSTSLSDTTGLPDGVFVGSLSDLPDNYVLPAPSMEGDLFSYLNGIGTPDLVVVIVPDGCKVGPALHVLYHSHQGGGDSQSVCVSSPRLVVLLGNGAEMDIIEEFGGSADTSYWSNSVLEVSIGDHAKLCHSYIQAQNRHALHFKWTFIQQGTFSSYKLVETSIGGRLSRHNLQIQQLGPDTTTEVSTFHLAGGHQTQDLHSKFILNHPRGYGRQLHKCIVTHSSGHAIFDGNIKVNRHAQLTDAGQLSRSLLLAPRATVNVKPNLQIVADDVKCSHGAAISDLEEDQLFYFQARGVDVQTARNALVFSFGAEVLERLPYKDLRERVESDVKCLLAAEGAIQ